MGTVLCDFILVCVACQIHIEQIVNIHRLWRRLKVLAAGWQTFLCVEILHHMNILVVDVELILSCIANIIVNKRI